MAVSVERWTVALILSIHAFLATITSSAMPSSRVAAAIAINSASLVLLASPHREAAMQVMS